jgi:hypothetical protein
MLDAQWLKGPSEHQIAAAKMSGSYWTREVRPASKTENAI